MMISAPAAWPAIPPAARSDLPDPRLHRRSPERRADSPLRAAGRSERRPARPASPTCDSPQFSGSARSRAPHRVASTRIDAAEAVITTTGSDGSSTTVQQVQTFGARGGVARVVQSISTASNSAASAARRAAAAGRFDDVARPWAAAQRLEHVARSSASKMRGSRAVTHHLETRSRSFGRMTNGPDRLIDPRTPSSTSPCQRSHTTSSVTSVATHKPSSATKTQISRRTICARPAKMIGSAGIGKMDEIQLAACGSRDRNAGRELPKRFVALGARAAQAHLGLIPNLSARERFE